MIEGVSLFDVGNCEGFIQRALDKSGIPYGPEEAEELLALGWLEFIALAEGYKPLPEPPCGYASWFAMTLDDRQVYERRLHADRSVRRGTFSGHMAMFFPRRFGDAWHKANPHHRYVTNPDTGKRGWCYDHPPISLNGLTETSSQGDCDGADRQLLHARAITAFCHTATIALLARTSPLAAS